MIWAVTALSLSVAMTLTPRAAQPATIHVNDGNCPGSGTEADPFCSIEVAVAAAVDGDEILIGAGIYTLTLGELVIDKDLTLTGSSSAPTIIQAARRPGAANGRVIAIGTWEQEMAPTVNIARVTIRYGNGARVGGGIWVNGRLTLVESTVSHNWGQWGGGIFV